MSRRVYGIKTSASRTSVGNVAVSISVAISNVISTYFFATRFARRSTDGASSCSLCQAGAYSEGGQACTSCPAGTYSEMVGAASAESCQECEAGAISGIGSTKCNNDVKSIFVSGMCEYNSELNGIYDPVALTESGRPWYRNRNGNGETLFFDPACSGASWVGSASWIFDNQEPSVTAEIDLVGECRKGAEEMIQIEVELGSVR